MALIRPRTAVLSEEFPYDGAQLRSHFIRDVAGLEGDAAIAWVGSTLVATDAMVDLEDVEQGLHIAADRMLHVIVESFGPDLDRAVLLQRLLVAASFELLREAGSVRREGDDLWLDDGKLSVSIATVSAVSCLVHLGINVTNAGTPVKTASLTDVGINPLEFAENLLARWADDLDGMGRAATKVRSVR